MVIDKIVISNPGDFTASFFEKLKSKINSDNNDISLDDIVILDIMGVKGFELLKTAVTRNFPTVILTAHALTPEALKKSIKLGAVFFLPKEQMSELGGFLEDVVLNEGKPAWKRLFDRLSEYFDKKFGPDWKEKDRFFKEFEESLLIK